MDVGNKTFSGLEVEEVVPAFLLTRGTEVMEGRVDLSKLAVDRYDIPNGLGCPAYNEVAARILSLCQEQCRFVAPSYRVLVQQVGDEVEELNKREQARKKSVGAEEVRGGVVVVMKAWLRKFAKPEIPAASLELPQVRAPTPTVPVVEKELPKSLIVTKYHLESIRAFHDAVDKMIKEGYLNLIKDEEITYLEPTAKLVDEILAKQKEATEALKSV